MNLRRFFRTCFFVGALGTVSVSARTLNGTVIDKTGAPVVGAVVRVAPGGAPVRTTAGGRFRLEVSGAVTLRCTDPRYRPWTVYAAADCKNLRIVLYDKRGGPRLRTTSCAPPGLVRIYSEVHFRGREGVFTKPGEYTIDERPILGQAKSLRVAPGWRVWFYCGDRYHPLPLSPYVVKPEDDPDLTDDHRVVGRIWKIKIESVPKTPFLRPRIFMALHGNQVLTRDENDPKWSYVRKHLDGIWFNAAGLSGAQMAAIFHKVRTRVIVKEVDANGPQAGKAGWEKPGVIWDSRLQERYPDIRLIREALCVYHGPIYCYAREIPDLRAMYVTNPNANPDYLYKHIYTLWQPYWVAPMAYHPKQEVLWGTVAETVFHQADGAGVECNPGLFAHNIAGHGMAVRHLLRRTHERPGRTFIWFIPVTLIKAGHPSPRWFQMVKNGYYLLEAERVLQPNDILMVINYSGALTALPETDPKTGKPLPTMTGTLYWLLHQ